MDVLRQDLRYAIRSLGARRSFTIIAVLTLALGIGATTSIFSVVRGILLRPLPYPGSDRILMVWETAPEAAVRSEGGMLSHLDFMDIRSDAKRIESIAQYAGANLTVTAEDGAELVRGARITPGLFQVFRTPLESGRDFTEAEDRRGGPKVAILSDGYWREKLGARNDVLGSTIRIAGESHTVVGIAAAGFGFPDDARIWIPSQNDDEGCGRGCVVRLAAARLSEGATLAAARSELAGIGTRLEEAYPESNARKTFTSALLRDVIVGDVRPALWVMLAAVIMVLLIACANVANLLLVRGRARASEIAVRATLGADRGRLMAQLLTESVLLALFAGLVGVVLSAWGIDLLRSRAPSNIPRLDEIGLDGMTLAFAGSMVALTVFLFGLAPALNLSRVELADTLRMSGRGSVNASRRRFGRSAFLITEVGLSVMLLLAAGLMVRSLFRMNRIDAGFDPEGVALFRLSLPRAQYAGPDQVVQFMDRVREAVAAIPGVDEAAIMVGPPLSNTNMFGNFTRIDRPEPEPGDEPSIDYRIVDDAAMQLLRIPMVAGRTFTASDRHGSQPVAIISREAARRYFPDEDPIGHQIQMSISAGYAEDQPRTIVGVFADPHSGALTAAVSPALYIPYAQSGASFPYVLMGGRGDAGPLIASARRVIQSLDPELPLTQPGSMQEFVTLQLAQPRFYLLLLGLFAFLAVVLAAVGMYGVVAYAVAQRTREIGVRMALGARVQEVIRLILWQGLRPAIGGIVLGTLASLAAGQLMRSLLFGVTPTDPLTFASVPLLLVAVVIAACAIPARRASRIPPATALRSD
jgi:putative ABC transport system permease protein